MPSGPPRVHNNPMNHPELFQLLLSSRHAVAFTGAGVSTLSGLPAFRGPKGLYSNPDYARMFDIDLFDRDPVFFYTQGKNLLYGEGDVTSSLVHRTLADWENRGLLKAVITQNIDLLHQQAGSKKVIEVHGSPAVHRCRTCGSRSPYGEIRTRVQAGEIPPRCSCGGVFKPDITFFGENLPEMAWEQALEEASRCDLMLVLGTSLTVQPAARLPRIALGRGAKLVIINDQPTDLDQAATLRLGDLEEALG